MTASELCFKKPHSHRFRGRKSTSLAGVSEVSEAAVLHLLWKDVLLLSGWGFEVAVDILVDENGQQPSIENDDKIFVCKRWSTGPERTWLANMMLINPFKASSFAR